MLITFFIRAAYLPTFAVCAIRSKITFAKREIRLK